MLLAGPAGLWLLGCPDGGAVRHEWRTFARPVATGLGFRGLWTRKLAAGEGGVLGGWRVWALRLALRDGGPTA